jgi:signal transduction histidine kinase
VNWLPAEWSRFRPSLLETLVVVVVLALIAAVLWGVFAYQDNVRIRSESREIINAVDGSMIALLEAESAQRGFVITGDEALLDPFDAALDGLSDFLADLGPRLAEGSDEREHYDHMSPLIVEKVAHMTASIEFRKSGDLQAAVTEVESGAGLMDEIQADLASIRRIEDDRLDARVDRTDRIGQFIGLASVTLAIVTLGLVAWLFLVFRRRQDATALRAAAAAKDEFVGFVSHELRAPLAVVSGNAHLLASGSLQAEERDEAVAEITSASQRLEDIVDTLLSLSKAESGVALEVEPILLHRIAQSVRRHHRVRYPEREVVIEAAADAPPALGDRGAVEQVLINLLSNAEKYGDSHAPIAITVECDGVDSRVCVINRGNRLQPEELDRVFEPFFRTPASTAAAPGIGLGLTICHRLIAAQGGRMTASAEPGGGARFAFTLPAAPVDDEH